MSAFLMSPEDLALIARAYVRFVQSPVDPEVVFDDLLNENLTSVGYRYPDAQRISDWFDDGEALFAWANIPDRTDATAEEIEDAVRSFQYQSCEHPGWQESKARRGTDLLREALAPFIKAEKDAKAAKVAERQAALAKLPTIYGKETAVVIRKILKATFPATKFSVRSDFNSVSISWTDGPTTQRVDSMVQPLRAGDFDGITDSYTYDRDSVLMIDGQPHRPGCQYVFTSRSTSPAMARRAAEQVAAYYGLPVPAIVEREHGYWQIEAGANQETWKRTGYDWQSLIHQATCDASRFARND